MKSWANTPMSYAIDIAIENHLGKTLEFPLDRIIYASNEYCFRERTRRNEGELNLPFLNYYRVGFDDADRPWKNDFSNRFGLIDRENKFTSLMGGKMRIYPITISYEATAFFGQNKDCEYAMNKLLFDSSNETIIKPQVETNDGDIIENAGGLDFTVTTYMIGKFDQNPDGLHVAKKVLLEFFTAKKLNYENYKESERMEILLSEYFGTN